MVQQMLTKGTVMAEEYRLQLADRMPMAAEAMEKATGLTGRALLDMMKKGKLASSEVLPKFGKELRKLAQNNNALSKTLATNRVAQSRMTTAYQKFMNILFKSGFSQGLTDLFNKITDLLSNLEGLGTLLGGLFKFVFGIVSGFLSSVKVPLLALSKILDHFSKDTNEGFDKFASVTVPKVIGALLAMAAVMTKIGKRFFLITGALVLIRATIEEIIGLTTKGVVSSIEKKLGMDVHLGNLGEAAGKIGRGGNTSDKSFGQLFTSQLVETFSSLAQVTGLSAAQSIVFNNTKMTVTSDSDFRQQVDAATLPGGY